MSELDTWLSSLLDTTPVYEKNEKTLQYLNHLHVKYQQTNNWILNEHVPLLAAETKSMQSEVSTMQSILDALFPNLPEFSSESRLALECLALPQRNAKGPDLQSSLFIDHCYSEASLCQLENELERQCQALAEQETQTLADAEPHPMSKSDAKAGHITTLLAKSQEYRSKLNTGPPMEHTRLSAIQQLRNELSHRSESLSARQAELAAFQSLPMDLSLARLELLKKKKQWSHISCLLSEAKLAIEDP